MDKDISGKIHALEFSCQAPLKFFEHCSFCPRFDENCSDLELGKELLRGKMAPAYNHEEQGEYKVDVKSFKCTVPLSYFEKTRMVCGHEGRCREEGLLLALLSGKKQIDYSQKTAKQFPYIKKRQKEEKVDKVGHKIAEAQ